MRSQQFSTGIQDLILGKDDFNKKKKYLRINSQIMINLIDNKVKELRNRLIELCKIQVIVEMKSIKEGKLMHLRIKKSGNAWWRKAKNSNLGFKL